MEKKTLAILIILVLATSGLFAYTVTVPGAVVATLRANIGEYLDHGFNISGTKYQSSVTIDNAFGITAPSFRYGYKTNAQGTLIFKMAVTNFINQTITGAVKIASVTSDKGASYVGGYYTIFSDTSPLITSAERSDEAIITINPARTADIGNTGIAGTVISSNEVIEGAPAGAYSATLTFSIAAS